MLSDFEIFWDKNKILEQIKINKNLENTVIVADFDRTFTTVESEATWWLVLTSGYFWEEYHKKAQGLFDYYYPIEIWDYSHEYKSEKMLEWWEKAMDLMVDFWVTKDDINTLVYDKDYVHFRQEAINFLKILYKKNIPIIFFSAGCGDVIEELLKREGLYNHNLFIEADFFEYDEENKVIWYKNKQIIHPENKDTFPLLPDIKEKIKNKKNCIIMWDNPADIKLKHLVDCENILSIAILANSDKKFLQKAGFDILNKRQDFKSIINLFFYK
jgi:HAD superfamily hydrolase (TIGR01544 family)